MANNNLQFSLVFAVIAWLMVTTGTAEINRFNVWELSMSFPIPTHGLDYTFYDESCPQAEGIVRSRVNYFIHQDITQAAGLLRLFYQDCFVKGCDASVLLRGSARGPWDISATPDQRLRAETFGIIDDIKYHLEAACPQIVSCADIIALAARDAILAAKGRYFAIPTGRRDSRVSDTEEDVSNSMPKPTWNVSLLLENFKSRGLDVVDLVALSGAHTIGKAHCSSFSNRLRPMDPRMSKKLARNLLEICPTENSTNTAAMDCRSPKKFDHKYYKDLMSKRGLFTSDEDLFYDPRTRELVSSFGHSKFFFFLQFAASAIKMSQLGILRGMEGEIRVNCWEPNYVEPSASPAPSPIPSPSIPPSPAPKPSTVSPTPIPWPEPDNPPSPPILSPTPIPWPEPDNPPPPPILSPTPIPWPEPGDNPPPPILSPTPIPWPEPDNPPPPPILSPTPIPWPEPGNNPPPPILSPTPIPWPEPDNPPPPPILSPTPIPWPEPGNNPPPPILSPTPIPWPKPDNPPPPPILSPTPIPWPEPENPPPPPILPRSYSTLLEYSANNIWLYILLWYVLF